MTNEPADPEAVVVLDPAPVELAVVAAVVVAADGFDELPHAARLTAKNPTETTGANTFALFNLISPSIR